MQFSKDASCPLSVVANVAAEILPSHYPHWEMAAVAAMAASCVARRPACSAHLSGFGPPWEPGPVSGIRRRGGGRANGKITAGGLLLFLRNRKNALAQAGKLGPVCISMATFPE
jgi:hypothetical protein